ncbi:MAG: DNA-binding protein WhiA [Lachnospiraceae bacterium]|nr:DNA-binding protein WhiA [Lachnospiraceae bacterium]
MSFSQSVKNELANHIDNSRHCQIAELCAFLSFEGQLSEEDAKPMISFASDYPQLQKKYFTLSNKTNSISNDSLNYFMNPSQSLDEVDGLIIQQTCCKRAYMRGAFLMAGSISDPNKGYHFEIVCKSDKQARQVQYIMTSLELDAKIVQRQKYHVVYLKEGEQIVMALGLMGASKALMDLENIRILKDMRNTVNRRVNCEAANISKTVNAAVKQIDDIKYIDEVKGLASLPDNLYEMAMVRLENPDASLKDLGELMDPPIGKSGVNHRLRKIGEIADKLR